MLQTSGSADLSPSLGRRSLFFLYGAPSYLQHRAPADASPWHGPDPQHPGRAHSSRVHRAARPSTHRSPGLPFVATRRRHDPARADRADRRVVPPAFRRRTLRPAWFADGLGASCASPPRRVPLRAGIYVSAATRCDPGARARRSPNCTSTAAPIISAIATITRREIGSPSRTRPKITATTGLT